MNNLWDDIYRPETGGQSESLSDPGGIDQLNAIIGGANRRPTYYNRDDGSEPSNAPEIKKAPSVKLPPITMYDRYERREDRDPPKTMSDRIDESRDRRDAPQTMMDKLNERDKERERIAKAEQAKLEESKEDYNNNRRSEAPEESGDNPNKVDRAVREGAHATKEELESDHRLSTLNMEREDQTADNADFEARIAALEAEVFGWTPEVP